MTYPTYHNLIGGEWHAGCAAAKPFANVNPADHADIVGAVSRPPAPKTWPTP